MWYSQPAIARSRGRVTEVHWTSKLTKICISGVSDAGSTYGDKSPSERECWDGITEGSLPRRGDCVVLESQAEGSELKVQRASGC
jgi:hypothetical protein